MMKCSSSGGKQIVTSMMRTPKPADFYGPKPPPRIISTETECNPQVAPGVKMNQYIDAAAVWNAGYRSVVSGNWSGLFLENGFGLYVDVEHLEVSAPEALGPKQAAAADLAGILLLAHIVAASGLPHNGIHRHSGTIIGTTERTSGHHQNFQIPRSLANSSLLDSILASHFTSDILSVAGTIKNGFLLSQKIKGIGDPPITRKVERRTGSNKPMAMIPPSANDATTVGNPEWARVERRFADAGFSPTTRFLGLAATSLVLRLLEHPELVDIKKLEGYSFRKFAQTAQIFSNDLTFTATAETRERGKITALNYQEIAALACVALSQEIELPEDERQAISLWLLVCDEMKKADFANHQYGRLLVMLDVAAKHYYLTSRFPGDVLSSSRARPLEANLSWDRILPQGGGMTYWEGVPSPYVSSVDVQKLLTQPPQTRAAMRRRLIIDPSFCAVSATWTSVTSASGRTVEIEPYGRVI